MNDMIRLTRQELYHQVWSEPMWTLAKRYGFSDVWLAKICRKHNIPRPPRGYWARKHGGYRVTQAPLPKKGTESIIAIRTYPSCRSGLNKKKTFLQEAGLARRRMKIPVVPDSLHDPHPLVKSSAEILASCNIDPNGLIMPPTEDCLDIHVTRDSLPRALLILDTLIKFLVGKGFEVFVSGGRTVVKILDIDVGMSIGEELARKRLKAIDHNLAGHYEFGYLLYEANATPSGRLFLTIHDEKTPTVMGRHLTWRDTESTRLENTLRRFVTGLARVAALKKDQMPLQPHQL
jgi:hypothetical protein